LNVNTNLRAKINGMAKPSPLHWETHEYEERRRSSDWFWAVGIITLAIVVTSIILGNILFALVILIGGFALILYAVRKPQKIDVVVDHRGVVLDKFFYPYHTLESFWVEEHENHPRILIKSQKLFMPYLIVPLGDTDIDEAREQLSHHLPEVFHSESIFHRLLEYLGF